MRASQVFRYLCVFLFLFGVGVLVFLGAYDYYRA